MTKVAAKIVKVLDHALLVELGDGRTGRIRKREVSWHETPEPLSAKFSVGSQVRAAILQEADSGGIVDLTLKQAEDDPWTTFAQDHKVGDLVEGRVVGITPNAVFVAVDQGPNGYLSIREIPTNGGDAAGDGDPVRYHDRIRAEITKLIPEERRLGLSVSRMLDREYQDFLQEVYASNRNGPPSPAEAETQRQLVASLAEAKQTERAALEISGRSRVPQATLLVVDDCARFRESFTAQLEEHGYRVLRAGTLVEAEREFAATPTVSGIFVDATIEQPFDGIQWAAGLAQEHPSLPIVVLSAQDIERVEQAAERCHLSATAMVCKPLGSHELDEVLVCLSSPQGAGPMRLAEKSRQGEGGLTETSMVGHAEDLPGALERLTREVGAEASALIELDSRRSTFRLRSCYLFDDNAFAECRHDLFLSPVADVLLKNRRVVVPDAEVDPSSARFQKMRAFAHFRSYAAISVLADSATPCGVFFFHRQRHAFGGAAHGFLEKAQAILERILDRSQVHHWAVRNQRYLLLGQMEAGLLHEVRNLLQPIQRQTNSLRVLHDAGTGLSPKDKEALSDLIRCNDELKALVDRMLGSLRDSANELVDPGALVENVAAIVSPTARQAGVVIEKHLHGVPKISTQPQRVVQILLNLCLNAVYAMEQDYIGPKRLRFALSHHANDAGFPVYIEVSDTGPGIHASDASRIFDPGFTTKRQGTGFGLSISRHLAVSIGADLSLTRACRFGGASFLLKLPDSIPHRKSP